MNIIKLFFTKKDKARMEYEKDKEKVESYYEGYSDAIKDIISFLQEKDYSNQNRKIDKLEMMRIDYRRYKYEQIG